MSPKKGQSYRRTGRTEIVTRCHLLGDEQAEKRARARGDPTKPDQVKGIESRLRYRKVDETEKNQTGAVNMT